MIVYTDKGKFEYCKYCDSETVDIFDKDKNIVQEGLCFECLVMEGLI